MRFMQNGKTCFLGFTDEHNAAAGNGGVELRGRVKRVARDAADRRVKVFVGTGIVLRRAEMQQMVAIDSIEQENLAVVEEVRMQRHAKQSKIAPRADFLCNVDHQMPEIVIEHVHATTAFPDEGSSIISEGNADNFGPCSAKLS